MFFGMDCSRQFLMGLLFGLTINILIYSNLHLMGRKTRQSGSITSIVNRIISNDNRSESDSTINSSSEQWEERIDNQYSNSDGRSEGETLAEKLYKQVRVLVWIMTCPSHLDNRAKAVKETWGKRCNELVFFSSVANDSFPAIGLNVTEGRNHLTAKTMQGFKYVYDHYFDTADWFMKADDDAYIIVENLRYFLSRENSSEPVYFGQLIGSALSSGFYSGGAGYVISKEALRRIAVQGNDSKICRQDGGEEDVAIAHCMQKLGVKKKSSIDALGRGRFHCFNPETHLHGNYHDWYRKYESNGAKKGPNSISTYAISFHYITVERMKVMDLLLYHLRPYGVDSREIDSSRKDT